MATLSRQPFAPLDGARLKSLASIKNRQNALSNSPVKRKASEVSDDDNSENIAPVLFSKRSKGAETWSDLSDGFAKPAAAFTLTKAASSPAFKDVLSSPPSRPSSARPRNILQPKSPAARLRVKSAAPSPLTAPAGRSPTRASKRVGILSRRRTQRPDPPPFNLGAGVPFSLDTALKGTIPSYSGSFRGGRRSSSNNSSGKTSSAALDFSLPTPDLRSSWCFNIHEDTPEQEMTNLLQHGTCTLDISSDEESETRAGRDRADGRDKENIPPPEDVSQTSSARGSPVAAADAADIDEDVLLLKGRGPLAEMNAADFYGEGCDSTSVFIVPGDEEDPEAVVDEGVLETPSADELPRLPDAQDQQMPCETDGPGSGRQQQHDVSIADVEAADIDDLMEGNDRAVDAAVLAPIEGATESFELWESNSAKDEGDVPASPAPVADEENPQPMAVALF
ncbi:7521f520-e2ab-4362-911c-e4f4eb6bf989 [Thermothielavioides terrestris]|uniref:Thymidylate kinase n=2 Tax=Thermothielavioides terrestris TaxID=2587410 RepID=G2QW43_THETT|nr:uncharacterized protein THITE_2106132 [Thermothielavioides terrestris NRRL 8126]AEO62214.1 hypothetical protein THITE_2106132 [Thermothielavioides terrestris NRRL 8126]SPQ24975.1 7521f520-e2ab-4362-911c-e4f4eb6bf989 [Thermothielavioides terrestris]